MQQGAILGHAESRYWAGVSGDYPWALSIPVVGVPACFSHCASEKLWHFGLALNLCATAQQHSGGNSECSNTKVPHNISTNSAHNDWFQRYITQLELVRCWGASLSVAAAALMCMHQGSLSTVSILYGLTAALKEGKSPYDNYCWHRLWSYLHHINCLPSPCHQWEGVNPPTLLYRQYHKEYKPTAPASAFGFLISLIGYNIRASPEVWSLSWYWPTLLLSSSLRLGKNIKKWFPYEISCLAFRGVYPALLMADNLKAKAEETQIADRWQKCWWVGGVCWPMCQ